MCVTTSDTAATSEACWRLCHASPGSGHASFDAATDTTDPDHWSRDHSRLCPSSDLSPRLPARRTAGFGQKAVARRRGRTTRRTLPAAGNGHRTRDTRQRTRDTGQRRDSGQRCRRRSYGASRRDFSPGGGDVGVGGGGLGISGELCKHVVSTLKGLTARSGDVWCSQSPGERVQ